MNILATPSSRRVTAVLAFPFRIAPKDYERRPEFVASLPVTVLSTMDLFNWWRLNNWTAVRTAILGLDHSSPPGPPASTAPSPAAVMPEPRPRRWWSRRQSGSSTT